MMECTGWWTTSNNNWRFLDNTLTLLFRQRERRWVEEMGWGGWGGNRKLGDWCVWYEWKLCEKWSTLKWEPGLLRSVSCSAPVSKVGGRKIIYSSSTWTSSSDKGMCWPDWLWDSLLGLILPFVFQHTHCRKRNLAYKPCEQFVA